MIETRIHHIDPNCPKNDGIAVVVKFSEPYTEESQDRSATVTVGLQNVESLTLPEIHQKAIQKARDVLSEVLSLR